MDRCLPFGFVSIREGRILFSKDIVDFCLFLAGVVECVNLVLHQRSHEVSNRWCGLISLQTTYDRYLFAVHIRRDVTKRSGFTRILSCVMVLRPIMNLFNGVALRRAPLIIPFFRVLPIRPNRELSMTSIVRRFLYRLRVSKGSSSTCTRFTRPRSSSIFLTWIVSASAIFINDAMDVYIPLSRWVRGSALLMAWGNTCQLSRVDFIQNKGSHLRSQYFRGKVRRAGRHRLKKGIRVAALLFSIYFPVANGKFIRKVRNTRFGVVCVFVVFASVCWVVYGFFVVFQFRVIYQNFNVSNTAATMHRMVEAKITRNFGGNVQAFFLCFRRGFPLNAVTLPCVEPIHSIFRSFRFDARPFTLSRIVQDTISIRKIIPTSCIVARGSVIRTLEAGRPIRRLVCFIFTPSSTRVNPPTG